MGQLGVGIGGAALAVGALALAGPSGGASIATYAAVAGLGFALGSAAGGLLFPPKGPHSDGAHLGDLVITASTYGVIRPIGHGTIQVSGNIIWATPIKEIANTSSPGGGGKGSLSGTKTTFTQYTYTSTFALALAQGPATGVIRIWMNGQLVYDASSGSNVVNDGSDNVNFRFYAGTADQLPDSLIEADKGVGNVSGYRGLCYLVFEDLLLTNFGDHIPNVQVEVSYGLTTSQDFQTLSLPSGTPNFRTIPGPVFVNTNGFTNNINVPTVQTIEETATGGILNLVDAPGTVPPLFTSYASQAIGIDPLRGKGYVWGIGPSGISEFDLVTMAVDAEYTIDYIMGTYNVYPSVVDGINNINGLWVGFDQNLYGILGGHVLQVNPGTFRNGTMIYCGNDDNVGGPFIDNFAEMGGPIGMTLSTGGLANYTVVGGGNMGNCKAIDFGGAPLLPLSGSMTAYVPGAFNTDNGAAYILGLGGSGDGNGGVLFVDRISLTNSFGTQSITSGNVMNILPTDVEAGATGWEFATGLVFDSVDNSIIFQAQVWNGGAGNWYLIKVDPHAEDAQFGIVWATQLPAGLGSGTANQSSMTSDLRQGSYAYFWGQHAAEFNTSDGTIKNNYTWTISNDNKGQVYSGAFNSIILFGGGTGAWVKVKVGRLAAVPETLETIVSDLCQMAGMSTGEFDATQLTTIPIDGFAVAQRTGAADILRPLLQLYQVDVVERDYKLVFQPRGGTPVTTITEDKMLRISGGKQNNQQPEAYAETRVQEIDLPMRFTISYTDSTVNYQLNTQSAKRTVSPNRTMYSDQQIDLQVAMVMTPDVAKQQAQKLLYTAWLERHTFKFSLPPDFLYLDTSDPVTLTLNSGFTARGRLGMFDLGADNSIQTTFIAESDGQYVSTSTGAASLGVPVQTVKYYSPTQAFLLDVPLLRDADDTGGRSIRGYWGVAPTIDGADWSAANLQSSADSSAWTDQGSESNEDGFGYLESPLPDAINSFRIHEFDTIIVRMQFGGSTMSSVTQTQMINGLNNAAVMKSNGDVEIIGFTTVTAVGNNRYQLQGLLRGRRGTDTMAGGHAANELFVLLTTSMINELSIPLALRNTSSYYRAVSQGTLAASAPIQTKAFHGRDQMPYAPVQVAAALSGSDIVLTWVRRTRINGGLVWGTGAIPLSEAAESYSVDVYNALGTMVLRTLTSSTPTTTYHAADIATDFGSTPTSLNVSVYQISATVGRGFARLDALEVV